MCWLCPVVNITCCVAHARHRVHVTCALTGLADCNLHSQAGVCTGTTGRLWHYSPPSYILVSEPLIGLGEMSNQCCASAIPDVFQSFCAFTWWRLKLRVRTMPPQQQQQQPQL